MQSFYSDFLNANDVNQQGFSTLFLDDYEMDYDDSGKDEEPESENVVDFPVKRFFVECGDLKISVQGEVESACILIPVPPDYLQEYFDGYLLESHPVAVRFKVKREDYIKLRGKIEDNDIDIIHFNHGFHKDYHNGVIISAARTNDDMTVIAAFETEGDPNDYDS